MFNINIQKNIVKGLGLQGLGIVQGQNQGCKKGKIKDVNMGIDP